MAPLLITMAVTVSDQAVKYLIRQHFHLYEALPVWPGFFDLRYIQNTGAAWGMFEGGHRWLAGLSAGVLAALVMWRRSFFGNGRLDRMAFGLVAGGITGNLIDRLRLNYVVDYLDLYWRGYHFPAFNIADSAICVGVGLLLLAQGRHAFAATHDRPLEKGSR